MKESKKEVVTTTEVREAIIGFTKLGYTPDRFFVAARRHTNAPFDPTKEAIAYRGNYQYVPSDPIQRFTAWFRKTDERKRAVALVKLIGPSQPSFSLEAEVGEVLSAA